jgi:restriction endonuclease S subunit
MVRSYKREITVFDSFYAVEYATAMKLGDIAQVIPGYAFRGAIKPDITGDTFVLQAKDLVQGLPITGTDTLTSIALEVAYSSFLQKHDVLLVSRGMKAGSFRSTVFMAEDTNVIASASVHVIRPATLNVIPEYLSHYLNSKKGQDDLTQIVTGSYIGAIPRRSLEQIRIPIPDLNKQKAIVDLFNNIQAQQKLLDRKKQLKQQIIEATFKNITRHHD